MTLYRPVGTKELELIKESGYTKYPPKYVQQFEVHTVGGSHHQELWVPAEELETFNRHITGPIQVVSEFTDR